MIELLMIIPSMAALLHNDGLSCARFPAPYCRGTSGRIAKIGFAPYPTSTKYSVLCDKSDSDITPDPTHQRNLSYAAYYGFDVVWIDCNLIN